MPDSGRDIKNPFTAYDIFGNVFPGAVFLAALYLYDRIFGTVTLSSSIGKAISTPDISKWLEFGLVAILDLIVVYTLGHLIAALSSAFVDRMLMDRVHGYPYKRLFFGVLTVGWTGEVKQVFIKAARCLFNTLFLVAIFFAPLISFSFWMGLIVSSTLILLIIMLVFMLTTGQIARAFVRKYEDSIPKDDRKPFKELRMRLVLDKALHHQSPYRPSNRRESRERHKRLKKGLPDTRWDRLIRALRLRYWRMMRVILPFAGALACQLERVFTLVEDFFFSLFRLKTPFPKSFQDAFINRFEEVFVPLTAQGMETNLFWLPAIHVCQKDQANRGIIQQAFNLYSFLRNMMMASYILAVYSMFVHVFAGKHFVEKYIVPYYWWAGLTVICALIFQVRYLNVYHNWYTKHVFRTFMLTSQRTPDRSGKDGNPSESNGTGLESGRTEDRITDG